MHASKSRVQFRCLNIIVLLTREKEKEEEEKVRVVQCSAKFIESNIWPRR